MQLNRKSPNSSEEKTRNAERHWEPRSGSKIPGLAQLVKSFWKYRKGNATCRTGECDVGLIIWKKMPFITMQSSNIWKLLQFGLIPWAFPYFR